VNAAPPQGPWCIDELLSSKWSLAILRTLLEGPARFARLRAAIPAVSANILSARLRLLEDAGVVERVRLPEPAARHVYRLTHRGAASSAVIQAIDDWSRAWADGANADTLPTAAPR
jgi:DNA-binding HxlR family transcriptional regulator